MIREYSRDRLFNGLALQAVRSDVNWPSSGGKRSRTVWRLSFLQ